MRHAKATAPELRTAVGECRKQDWKRTAEELVALKSRAVSRPGEQLEPSTDYYTYFNVNWSRFVTILLQ
jgi:hypothetical protein